MFPTMTAGAGPGGLVSDEKNSLKYVLAASNVASAVAYRKSSKSRGLDAVVVIRAHRRAGSAPPGSVIALSDVVTSTTQEYSCAVTVSELEPAAPAGDAQGDPKWQEVATKLDLAKAYEEMGDKDGARELLNEVLREGDAAQQGQANQLLAKLG